MFKKTIFVYFSIFIYAYAFSTDMDFSAKGSLGEFDNKISLSWTSIPEADFYNISRSYDANNFTKRGKTIPIVRELIQSQIKDTKYEDTKAPFGMHKYLIEAFKIQEGNAISLAKIEVSGYRKISNQEFFFEFQKAIESSLPRIRSMKRLNLRGEKKIGWKHGYLIYKTSGVFTRPFTVTINYENFVDQSLTLNGIYQVCLDKLLTQKGKLVGIFKVSGIYEGTVTHNLIIHRGKAVGGTYDVQQKDHPFESLPWNITEHPLDDSQYPEATDTSSLQSLSS